MSEIVTAAMVEKAFGDDELDVIPDKDWNQRLADSINKEIENTRAIPEGMVIVPIKSLNDIQAAVLSAFGENPIGCDGLHTSVDKYNVLAVAVNTAMLQAIEVK